MFFFSLKLLLLYLVCLSVLLFICMLLQSHLPVYILCTNSVFLYNYKKNVFNHYQSQALEDVHFIWLAHYYTSLVLFTLYWQCSCHVFASVLEWWVTASVSVLSRLSQFMGPVLKQCLLCSEMIARQRRGSQESDMRNLKWKKCVLLVVMRLCLIFWQEAFIRQQRERKLSKSTQWIKTSETCCRLIKWTLIGQTGRLFTEFSPGDSLLSLPLLS